MKVVFIDHSASLGGAEIALIETIRALLVLQPELEAQVIVFESGDLVDDLEAMGVSVVVVPFGAANDLRRGQLSDVRAVAGVARDVVRQTLAVTRLLRSARPDMVHTNSMKAHVIGAIAARLIRRPVVWDLNDRIADDYLPSVAVHGMRMLARVLPTAVMANSASTASTVPGSVRSVVVPSPVAGPTAVIAEPDEPFTVGCLGRLATWKGQHVLLEAFAAAFPDGDERLRIVGAPLFGEQAYEQRLHDQAERLGIARRVEFVGHVRDVYGELARVHVLVHCSTLPEPFGRVVVEGLAAGRAVIAADAGGPAEVIDDGLSGLLTPPGDVAALGQALVRLRADPGLRAQLVERGLEEAPAYAPARIADAVLRLYRVVLPDGAVTPRGGS